MILVLDTNIVVDVLSGRDGGEASLSVIKLCEIGAAKGFITTTTVTDVVYILRTYIKDGSIPDSVEKMLSILDLAEVSKEDIKNAFHHEMADYEDAVLALCAKRYKADYIVTRNLADFKGSPVEALSPEELLRSIHPSEKR
jgi:predicted nucleic acid-binding protein